MDKKDKKEKVKKKDKTDNLGEATGSNTITPSRQTQGKRWAFTWFNYTKDNLDKMEIAFRKEGVKYVYGLEICPSTEREHIQGYIESEKQYGIRPIECFNLSKEIHWEKARKDQYANFRYCSKDKHYYTNFVVDRPDLFIENLKYEDLWEYQQGIVELHDTEPDRRSIYWLWESEGCRGKTVIGKWLMAHRTGVAMSSCTKSADILLTARNNVKTYIISIPRSCDFIHPWAALEQLKDGFITDCKLKKEARIVNCAPPHVIVLANFEPNYQFLSKDRWIVVKI